MATVSGLTITPVAPGLADLNVHFNLSHGDALVYVGGTPTTVTSLALSYPSLPSSGGVYSLGGGATSAAASVAVTFSDGSSLANAVASLSNVSSLLSFSTSDPHYVGISSTVGSALLVNNSWRFANLTAASVCSDGRTSTAKVDGNLYPAVYDTKIGALTYLTFPATQSGNTVSLPININVGTAKLVSFQARPRAPARSSRARARRGGGSRATALTLAIPNSIPSHSSFKISSSTSIRTRHILATRFTCLQRA